MKKAYITPEAEIWKTQLCSMIAGSPEDEIPNEEPTDDTPTIDKPSENGLPDSNG